MSQEEMVKMEMKPGEATGELGEILKYVGTLPMTMPKSVVTLLVRLAFTGAYTQYARDLAGFNNESMAELSKVYEEFGVKLKQELEGILMNMVSLDG